MYERLLKVEIEKIANQVPVLTIIGPRQAGKTTLVRDVFPDYTYVNLEDLATQELAKSDYVGFFEKYKEPMIIDEIQKVPSLLSAIQVRVDADRKRNGRFILTGSHQPKLREAVSQSLAGRTSIMSLLPLSIAEICTTNPASNVSVDELIIRGFMPELYQENSREPYVYYRDYLQTYIEKDLRDMISVKDLNTFVKFLKLLAGRVGQVANLKSISNEIGVSSTTLANWLSVLEDSFVVFQIAPYFSNISKRIVKSSKVYFTEPGLAAYLLGIETTNQASRDPLRGNLFENIVMVEAIKARYNANREPNLYYLRTEKGVEVDLILRKEGWLYPFEIKTSMTPNKDFSKHLKSFVEAEEYASDPRIVYAGEEYPLFSEVNYINYRNISKYMV